MSRTKKFFGLGLVSGVLLTLLAGTWAAEHWLGIVSPYLAYCGVPAKVQVGKVLTVRIHNCDPTETAEIAGE